MRRLRTSLRLRLVITFTLLTAVGGLILFLIASKRLQDSTLEFYERDLESEVLIASNSVLSQMGEAGDEGGVNAGSLRLLLKQLRSRPDYDLTMFDQSLNPIASTADQSSDVPPSPKSPELAAAQTGSVGRDMRFNTAGIQMFYVAVPIGSEEGGIRGILQIQSPLQPAYDLAQSQSIQLAGVWLPVVVLSAAISLWVGQSLARPIQQLNASALRIANGALNERISVKSRDEIGQLGDAFNYMVERLNLLITAQRSFVSNAAHELRGPLTNLNLRIEAIQDERLPADQKATYLQEAAAEIKRMSDMVTSLLMLARLDEGRYRIVHEPFDPVLLLSDAARHWRIQAQKAGLKLHLELPDSLPLPRMNPGDLRIVLDNLLSNALKYTPPGGEIRLQAAAEPNTLRLDVCDTGEGFSAEEKERLFERFYRAPRSRERSIAGTGLGLSIVREILKQYDGSVAASSDGSGKGAVFTVRLPLA